MADNKFLAAFSFAAAILATSLLPAQQRNLLQQYSKTEVRVPMRDGTKLHTTIYAPRDSSRSYPIVITRTPYSSQPYGRDRYPGRVGPSEIMQQEGYIFVSQDVRGRWMSEGQFDNMRPNQDAENIVDESSDTYDTIDWLLKNVPNNNGRVGMWGISYPGFYTAAALPNHHPALVAATPQAPISDFYFDDFHHNGAYLLSYFLATATFGYQHTSPQNNLWYRTPKPAARDAWNYYLNMVPVADAYGLYGQDNFFWNELVEHPNYDEFWKKRSILPHLKDIKTNVMTVGGWFDAEDLYGPLNIYQSIEKQSPDAFNILVMGPWSHGNWSRNVSRSVVGNYVFGERLSEFYQRNVEAPFFRYFLKNSGEAPKFEALVYDSGARNWRAFADWPPRNAQPAKLFLNANRTISINQPLENNEPDFLEFVSDPNNPVPYRAKKDISFGFTPRAYMADDQRFASSRPDVLVFQSEILQQPVTLSGDLIANLNVTTTGTDADWVVKLIDVHPDNVPNFQASPIGASMAGYQLMVRSEVMRGRFRDSFSDPKPFEPGEVTSVKVPLQDVFHTFKPGHRIMIHVQSTWFPLIDRNPQTFVENIFKAQAGDYQPATHRVYIDSDQPSWIETRLQPAN